MSLRIEVSLGVRAVRGSIQRRGCIASVSLYADGPVGHKAKSQRWDGRRRTPKGLSDIDRAVRRGELEVGTRDDVLTWEEWLSR